jgi:two-component system response regulator EvgA
LFFIFLLSLRCLVCAQRRQGIFAFSLRPSEVVTVKAIVIDEQPLMRIAISTVLSQVGFTTVQEADNGASGMAFIREQRPDLVVLDVELPRISGLELIDRIHAYDKSVEVLVFTAYPAEHYYGRCRIARASGFLPKTCSVDQLMSTVDQLMNGQRDLTDVHPNPAYRPSADIERRLIQTLSNREMSTFVLLARGMANKEIAEHLLISNKTVSTYKMRLMTKLRVPSLLHLSDMAQRNGLVDRMFSE